MLGRHAPPVPCQFMIIRRFVGVAPVANRCEVAVIVSAAVFKREDVIHIPIISRTQLALALVAATSFVQKDPRTALC